jgi:iron complex transport system substrate-binding protein
MPHTPRPPRLSRRDLLAGGGALGLGALLTACGGDEGAPPDGGAATGASGPFRFTDDRGRTVRLGQKPERVVAFVGTAAALHDYGVECTGVFGPTTTESGRADVQAGDLDVEKLTVLGNAFGEFDVEKYASLRPELLVTSMYEKNALWYVPQESKDQILKLAPSIGLTVARVSLPEPLERHAELAEALGADMSTSSVTRAQKRFEKAADELRTVAKQKKGLRVMAASGSPDLFYVSTPAPSADLRWFRELGVEFVEPDDLDKGGFYESLSWEKAAKYGADVIMLDNRSSALQPKALRSKPTWSSLPAVEAGQVVPWVTEPRFSYAGCAPVVEDLTAALRRARPVT